jgi:uncharacterized protein YndB with AHSA1/START domain
MDATLEKHGNWFTIRFERELAHPPEKVWRALTEPALLRQWFPCEVEGDWAVGAGLKFIFPGDVSGIVAEEDTKGEVLALEAGRLLEFSWGTTSVLRMEIVPTEKGCRFVFSDTKSDPSIVARDGAGWQACLVEFLSVLETGASGKYQPEDWRVPFAKYTAKFEPDAGPQQGPPIEVLEGREAKGS